MIHISYTVYEEIYLGILGKRLWKLYGFHFEYSTNSQTEECSGTTVCGAILGHTMVNGVAFYDALSHARTVH